MRKLSRFLRNVPGGGPVTHLPDCHTAVEMGVLPVVVILRRVQSGEEAAECYVGLALQENGVRVDVERVDLDELMQDLAEAREWLRAGGL